MTVSDGLLAELRSHAADGRAYLAAAEAQLHRIMARGIPLGLERDIELLRQALQKAEVAVGLVVSLEPAPESPAPVAPEGPRDGATVIELAAYRRPKPTIEGA